MPKDDMKEVMEYLADAEGTKVHYLSTEEDFTAPFGIYAKAHPNSKIVKRIQAIAVANGIYKKSKKWNSKDIKKINFALKNHTDEIYSLAVEFYRDFTKSAKLEFFPKKARVAMYSMYANSPKRAWKAVQQSLLDVRDGSPFSFTNRLSSVDGVYGSTTGKSLMEFRDYLVSKNDSDQFGGLYFETLLLSNMKTQYIRLALANPAKYLHFLKGWDNRMSKLQRLK